MPDDRSDIVEVFDVERDVAPAEPDEVSQGGDRSLAEVLNRWPWWRRNDALAKILTAAGVAGLIVAAVAGYGALTASPGTQFFVNQTTIAAPAVTVDALGCPRESTCAQAAAPPALRATILRLVPSGRVTFALQTVDASSGRVYRRELDLSAPKTTVRVVSQCVPGAGAVSAQPMTVTVDIRYSSPPKNADPRFTGPRRLVQLVPGKPGCSLFLEGQTTLFPYELDGRSVDELLALLAAEPALMVTP